MSNRSASVGDNGISLGVQTDIPVFRESAFLTPKTSEKFGEFDEGVSLAGRAGLVRKTAVESPVSVRRGLKQFICRKPT